MALFLLFGLVACGDRVPVHEPQVLRTLPHDPGAYTQGLLLSDGRFFESTGQYGSSTLREVDRESGEVLRRLDLPEDYFGEGLALVGDRLVQLTWREEVAFVYPVDTFHEIEDFDQVERFEYEGEGWGLCYDGTDLWMTNGGAYLYRRDPETFEVRDLRQVTLGGSPLRQTNELACVGDFIYANVFTTDRIVKIDKATAEVVMEFDGSVLVPEGGRPADPEAVLNGIAWDPETETFYLTGKLWPTIFEVRLQEGD